MDQNLYRQKSMDRISSPEQLNDYLRVTNVSVWVILIAVILLLAGMLIWSSAASIDSFVTATAHVEDGSMRILLDDEQYTGVLQPGMTVRVGSSESTITSIGISPSGVSFATAETTLTDGSYPAKIVLRRTQVRTLLFN